MRNWIGSSFPQVMVCRLFDTKHLSYQRLYVVNCTLWDKLVPEMTCNNYRSMECICKCRLQYVPPLSSGFSILNIFSIPDFPLISVLCYQPDPDRSFWVDLVPKGWMRRLKTLCDVTTKSANHDVIDICRRRKCNNHTMAVVVIVFMK